MTPDEINEIAQAVSEMLKPLLTSPGEKVYTTQKAADFLGVSKQKLDICRVKGGGPVYAKIGRNVRYLEHDLVNWLEQNRKASTSDEGKKWQSEEQPRNENLQQKP